jgi:hypothetical protein
VKRDEEEDRDDNDEPLDPAGGKEQKKQEKGDMYIHRDAENPKQPYRTPHPAPSLI